MLILVKKGRNSKFAPKAVEGFLLGYDSIGDLFSNAMNQEQGNIKC